MRLTSYAESRTATKLRRLRSRHLNWASAAAYGRLPASSEGRDATIRKYRLFVSSPSTLVIASHFAQAPGNTPCHSAYACNPHGNGLWWSQVKTHAPTRRDCCRWRRHETSSSSKCYTSWHFAAPTFLAVSPSRLGAAQRKQSQYAAPIDHCSLPSSACVRAAIGTWFYLTSLCTV